MNEIIVIGTIRTEVGFEFVYGAKEISICYFSVQLKNHAVVKVKCYDEIANLCYQTLKKGDIVLVEGALTTSMEILVVRIEQL